MSTDPPGPFCFTCESSSSTIVSATPTTTKRVFSSTLELYAAVDLYLLNPSSLVTAVARTYGHPIGAWDVSQITDFGRLFSVGRNVRSANFSEDLNGWNVSGARNMQSMFSGKGQVRNPFNGNIDDWDVSSVRDMSEMFGFAHLFNRDLSKWDVSRVQNVSLMFWNATSFQQNLCDWGMQLPSTAEVFLMFDSTMKFCNNALTNIFLNKWRQRFTFILSVVKNLHVFKVIS